ncbi:UNVERIFIED_CONTAM: hypothetical protein GTU68_011686 [Idotea baltica]|nr:hypothetical protein [Idotea baltica]
MMARYRGKTNCPDCNGTRLRPDSKHVLINNVSINDLVEMPIKKLIVFFEKVKLTKAEQQIAKRLLTEINNRLHFMQHVGLEYLTINRLSASLSGGETQRIHLTRSLGSNLTNSMYILDEPSIGLHPRDTQRLIKVMRQLRDLGNTVIVVEHEEEVIRSADYIIDMGPLAGALGGEVIFYGDSKEILTSKTSLTGEYLTGKKKIDLPLQRRRSFNKLFIKGAEANNLKNIDVEIPLQGITVVSGVSGSGKTSLIKNILYPALQRKIEKVGQAPGKHKSLEGDVDYIKQVEMIDQQPLGRSSRSNPVTYIKAYDAIRKLFSDHKLSKVRGYKPKHFSFNVEGGRCETCKGDGEIVVEMQFLADVHLVCDECEGKRFKPDVLEVKYNKKNIFDVLSMTVDEALIFFEPIKEVFNKIKPLQDVGLGYVGLGQSSSTLSGGEAQRVKLASFLGKGISHNKILFIFDEPTTGLHFNDIHKLLKAFNALVENGHGIVVIEHNMDIIKCADWIIDLGPEGGEDGGYLLYQGQPEGLLKVKKSYTAKFLAEKL